MLCVDGMAFFLFKGIQSSMHLSGFTVWMQPRISCAKTFLPSIWGMRLFALTIVREGKQKRDGCVGLYIFDMKSFFLFCLNAGRSAILSIFQSALIAFDAICHEVLLQSIWFGLADELDEVEDLLPPPVPELNDGSKDIGSTFTQFLLIRKLDSQVTEEMVAKSVLKLKVPLKRVILIRDRISKRSWCFGFLEYYDSEVSSFVGGCYAN